MTAAPAPFKAFTTEWLPAVEETLQELLPSGATPPATLHEAMRYTLFPGGKRLRPMLVLMGARVSGGDPGRVLRPAAAAELLHTYSLVHDDLPCMDDDDLRRGRPTCHKVYGEAMAVLVGDALLTLAFEAIADGGAEAVRTLAAAAGSQGMVGGQVQDLAAGNKRPRADDDLSDPSELSELQWIHDHKTGALITACLRIGALAGGGRPEALAPLTEYGRLIGRAFQVADDCLDRTAATEALGKRPGQDVVLDKLTYPAVMGLSESQVEARRLASAAAALAPSICASCPEPASPAPGGPGGVDSEALLLQDVAFYTVSRGS